MSTPDNPLSAASGQGVKKRYLAGAGAAACAVCCAAPILTLLGIAGTGLVATAVTMMFAGVAFGLVVLLGTALAVFLRRRRRTDPSCHTEASSGPVAVELSLSSPDSTPPTTFDKTHPSHRPTPVPHRSPDNGEVPTR